MPAYPRDRYDLTESGIVSVIDDLTLWAAPFGLKLLEQVTLGPRIRMLDIGTGLGFPLIELSQRLGETCTAYGIDPWREALERTKLKIDSWRISNVCVVEGKAEGLPFEDACFDLVVSNNGINNVEDDEQALREIARVTRRGAQLVVTVNLPDTMAEFYDVFEEILRDTGKTAEIDSLRAHRQLKRKPLSHTEDLLRRSGFSIRSVFEGSFCFRFTDGSAMLDHFVMKMAFCQAWLNVVRPEDINPVFSALESRLNDRARVKGELSLSIPWVCIDGERGG